MKRIFNKLIGMLSVICLLASHILPAGMVSFAAGTTNTTDPIVTEITFPGEGTSNWSPKPAWYFGGTAETPYTISFDYYLPADLGGIRFYSVSGGMTTVSGGSMDKTAGYHHFEWVGYTSRANGQLVTAIEATGGDQMYLWNWSVKVNDAEVTPTDKSSEWNGKTNGTEGQYLIDYDWHKHMDDPAVTEITFPGTGTSNWSPKPAWYYGGNSEANAYTVSFDYYLPEEIGGIRFYSVSGGMTTVSGGSMDRTAGYHHFEWVAYNTANNGQLVTAIEATGGDQMYLWNWSVKVNDAEATPTDKSNEWNGKTNGIVGKLLGQYDWAKYINSPKVTEILFPGEAGTSSSFSPAKFWYFGGDSEENAYTITFDYYLPEAVASLEMDSVSGRMTTVSGSRAMPTTAGFHSVSWTTWTTVARGSQTGQFVAQIKAPAGTEMYLWNWSVKIKGQEVTPSTLTEANAATNGTVGKYLVDYAWANPDAEEPEKTVTSIEIATPATKTEYEIGESLDTTGLSVKVNYSDESSDTITEGFEVSGFDSAIAGEKTITVIYEDFTGLFTATFTVTVNEPVPIDPVPIDPESIEIATRPIKTVYELDETFDATGLSVKVNYSDDSSDTITEGFEVSGFDSATAGKKTVIVTYEGFMATFTVTVNEPASDDPIVTKVEIGEGETWYIGDYRDYTGTQEEYAYELSFEYYMPDEYQLKFTNFPGWMTILGGSADLKGGHHTMSVKIKSERDDAQISHIFLPVYKNSATDAVLYVWNMHAKLNGRAIQLHDFTPLYDGKPASVDTSKSLKQYEWAIPGEDGVAPMDKYQPTRYITSIEIATPPAKTVYKLGETLDTAGLSVKVNYSDETDDTVTEGFEVSGFDSAMAGEKTLTVTHEGFTATFTVTVKIPVIDEDTPAFTVETAGGAVRAGDIFTVTVSTKNNPGIVSLKVEVGYDAEVLELVSITGQEFVGTTFGPLTANPIAVNWCDALNPNNTTDGVVAVLTFKVKDDASAGDAAITVSYDPNDVYDFDFANVTFATVGGVVSIVDYMSGDANGDGEINNKDLGLLQRHINGWDVAIDTHAVDVNDDGEINNKDLGLLQRYINGWDVELQ